MSAITPGIAGVLGKVIVMTEPEDLIPSVFARDCASRYVLADVTGRWGHLALAALHDGSYRFNALRRRVDGVSEKMLAQTLKTLERDGFVHRDAQPVIPPRVDYSLTDRGEELAALLVPLVSWVAAHAEEVLAQPNKSK